MVSEKVTIIETPFLLKLGLIFWTSVVWIFLIGIFYVYTRFFNKPLIVRLYGVSTGSVMATGTSPDVRAQLDALNTKLDSLIQAGGSSSTSVTTTTTMPSLPTNAQTIKLYYFNQDADEKLPALQRVSVSSVMPIERTVLMPSTSTTDMVTTALDELLKGNLTDAEKAQGFITTFPNPNFKLLGVVIDDNGIAILHFTEVPGLTSGGSAAMAVLAQSIRLTASQFPGVTGVQFAPDTLFQP